MGGSNYEVVYAAGDRGQRPGKGGFKSSESKEEVGVNAWCGEIEAKLVCSPLLSLATSLSSSLALPAQP